MTTILAANSDGTNAPGSNGVAPEASPNPRGQPSRHYDRLGERVDDGMVPDAGCENEGTVTNLSVIGTKRIKAWLNKDDSDEQEAF
jgi:hypothetical protein